MQLILIRHSYTSGNLEHRYIGSRTDEPLCEKGIQNAKQKAVHWHEYGVQPECVLVSPMRRCLETAAILFPTVKQVEVSSLRECDFGVFEGKNYVELNGDEAYQTWIDSAGTMPFPEGESRDAFIDRCCKGLEHALQSCVETTVAVVAHGGTMMAILSECEESATPYFDWKIPHCVPIWCQVLEKKPLRIRKLLLPNCVLDK